MRAARPPKPRFPAVEAALRAERDQPFALARAHEISGDVARRLVRDVDLQEGRFV